jgi:hypothetical protein
MRDERAPGRRLPRLMEEVEKLAAGNPQAWTMKAGVKASGRGQICKYPVYALSKGLSLRPFHSFRPLSP